MPWLARKVFYVYAFKLTAHSYQDEFQRGEKDAKVTGTNVMIMDVTYNAANLS